MTSQITKNGHSIEELKNVNNFPKNYSNGQGAPSRNTLTGIAGWVSQAREEFSLIRIYADEFFTFLTEFCAYTESVVSNLADTLSNFFGASTPSSDAITNLPICFEVGAKGKINPIAAVSLEKKSGVNRQRNLAYGSQPCTVLEKEIFMSNSVGLSRRPFR